MGNGQADMLDIEAAGLRSHAAALEVERQEILLAQAKAGEQRTLRDWFAGHAPVDVPFNYNPPPFTDSMPQWPGENAPDQERQAWYEADRQRRNRCAAHKLVCWRYEFADAMLAARTRGPEAKP